MGRCQSVYDDNLRVRGVSAYAGVSGDAMHWDPMDPEWERRLKPDEVGRTRAHP